jgi:hypothetical protein
MRLLLKYFFLSFLFCSTARAAEMSVAFLSDNHRSVSMTPQDSVSVRGDPNHSTRNNHIYVERFASRLRENGINAVVCEQAPCMARFSILVGFDTRLQEDTTDVPIYHRRTTGVDCETDRFGNTNCEESKSEREQTGTREVDASLKAWVVVADLFEVDESGGEKYVFNLLSTLIADVDVGMCTDTQAFDWLTDQSAKNFRPGSVVDLDYTIGVKKAGCRGKKFWE